ncbi:GTP pyrophosphokinase family protein [Clostridium sp. DSM 8431]|uniref:GTP pyrophosphokinase n=1 Tax=Clostridium sp. DSM 8431 TaxID=1761781 RepID=UPI000B7E4ED9|nr:GTP pyrophosphokinase family protein [Clostridium sp. DSM 8431]
MEGENMLKKIGEKFVRERLISDEFFNVIHKNMMPLNELMAYYRCAIMEVETKFKVLDEQFSLQYDRNPIEGIKSRLKSPEGIAKKLKKKNLDFSIESIQENIRDVAGVRVICSFPEDIYMLADCLLSQDDITLIEKKDYIKNPKKSGYRSLHFIIEVPIFLQNEKKNMKVEVQLRTIAMDFWASLEHKLRYKKNIDENEVELLEKELIECAEISSALDRRMEEIRNRIEKK